MRYDELLTELKNDVVPVLPPPIAKIKWRSLKTAGELRLIVIRLSKRIKAHVDHSTFHLCGEDCRWCSLIKRKPVAMYVALCVVIGEKPRIEVVLIDPSCLLLMAEQARKRNLEDVVFRVMTSVGDKILSINSQRINYEVEDLGGAGEYQTYEMKKAIIDNTNPLLLNGRKLKEIAEVLPLVESQGIAVGIVGVSGESLVGSQE